MTALTGHTDSAPVSHKASINSCFHPPHSELLSHLHHSTTHMHTTHMQPHSRMSHTPLSHTHTHTHTHLSHTRTHVAHISPTYALPSSHTLLLPGAVHCRLSTLSHPPVHPPSRHPQSESTTLNTPLTLQWKMNGANMGPQWLPTTLK